MFRQALYSSYIGIVAMPFRLTREDTGRVKGTSNGGRLPTRHYSRCEWNEHIPEDAARAATGRPTLCEVCGKKVKLCPSCKGFHIASKAKYAVCVERCNQQRWAREFSAAAAAGDAQEVARLIDQGVDVNVVDVRNGMATACYVAAEGGHVDVVKALLDFRADVRAAEMAERAANTPEALAERKRREEEEAAIQAAVEASAASKDISASSKVREFALENKVNLAFVKGTGPKGKILKRDIQGYLDIIDGIAEENAAEDGAGGSRPGTASGDDTPNGVRPGTNEGAKGPDGADGAATREEPVNPLDLDMDPTLATDSGFTPITIAARKGYDEILRMLHVSGRTSVNNALSAKIGGAMPIHLAAEGGHISTLKVLVCELGANVNGRRVDGCTAAMAALLSEQVKAFETLATDLGADLGIPMNAGSGMAPIHVAAQKGLLDVVKLIHQKGFCDDEAKDRSTINGMTALHFAVERNDIPMVTYLVRVMGCNVNAPTLAGVTPMFTALVNTDEANAESLAQELISLGGSLAAVTNQGFTPLIAAAARGDLAVVKIIVGLDESLDINAMTKSGKTAVYCASENGHDKVVNWLADRKADLDVQTETGSTAAMASADNGHIQSLNILARYRADLSLVDMHGNTATSLAVRNGHALKKGVMASTGELLPHIPPVADILGAKDRQQEIDLKPAPGMPQVFGWTPGTRLVKFGTGDICTNHEPIPASKRRHVKLSVTDDELASAPAAEKVSKPWE